MNALDAILKSCIPTDESPKRRPSVFSVSSKQSNTRPLLSSIVETYDNIIKTVHEIPVAMEEKLNDFVQTVAEIPTTIEESFDDLIHTLNEYIPIQSCLS